VDTGLHIGEFTANLILSKYMQKYFIGKLIKNIDII